MPEQRIDESDVLFATSNKLAHGEVMHFEAPTGRSTRVLVADRDETLAPAAREHWRIVIDPVRIVAKRFVKDG